MPRSTHRDAVAAAPRPVADVPTREARLTELLAKLARRAGSWGWLSSYERVLRGEAVPRWHLGMMKLTAAKRSGEFRRPKDVDDE